MAADKLTWSELRRALASRADISEKEANAFLNAFNAQLVEALKQDKQVKINGLGTFKLQAVAPRKSVNITTGEEITIEGYNKIAFVPEAGVKELVESNGEGKATVEKPEAVDPIKKLGAQADEIVDILGELGQSPTEEPKAEPEQAPEQAPEPEPEPTPAAPVIPVVPASPAAPVTPAKPKKKYHFLRDTLICVIILLALLLVGYFFLRHQLSSWIDSLVNKPEQTEMVVAADSTLIQEESDVAFEEPIIEEPIIEESVLEGFDKDAIKEEAGALISGKTESFKAWCIETWQKICAWFESLTGMTVEEVSIIALDAEEGINTDIIEEAIEPTQAPSIEAASYDELLLTEGITYGSRLAWIAKKYYGNRDLWPYLYDANRDRIDNPSRITVGTKIRVPKLSAAQRDTTSASFQALKEEAYSAIK